jgi:heptosyltransferase II
MNEPQSLQNRHLIIRLRNWIGDVILGLPALQLLEQHGYHLHLVGKPWAASLLQGHGWPVEARPKRFIERVRQLHELKAYYLAKDPQFSTRENAVVFPTSFSAALDMRCAGLKAVGYSQEARGLLLKRSEPITYGGHALMSYWELACRFLQVHFAPPSSINFKVDPLHSEQAVQKLKQLGVAEPFVVICPFAGGTFEKMGKTWPAFPELTRQLLKLGLPVVVCPGPGEERTLVEHYPQVVSIAGLSLGHYAGILKKAALVISNDTGPGHLAAAVGTPLISVLGPTKPEQWAPWGNQVHVIRKWPLWPDAAEVMSLCKEIL